MKKTFTSKSKKNEIDDILPEYHFDYSKAKNNRFAGRIKDKNLVVKIDADISKIFGSSEKVNHALRALIEAFPKRQTLKSAR